MSEFNLIPADYAREQALRRRFRWAIASLVVVCGVLVLGRSALVMLVAAERDNVAQLQVKKRLWQESKLKTEKYVDEARSAEKQLVALDELRGRDQLRRFLEALDSAYVDKVWFDEIRYFRREDLPAGSEPAGPGVRTAGTPAQKKAAVAPRVEQRVGMVGHAMNHVTLAEFMRKLESQPAISDLMLVDTGPRAYPGALVIDFKLGLLVDRKTKGVP